MQRPERQHGAVDEGHLPVGPYLALVVGVHVEEGREAAVECGVAELAEHALRVAATGVARVSADGGQLLVAVEAHALAGHGREAWPVVDAEIAAHLERTRP